jgi:predicted transcriptional regulator
MYVDILKVLAQNGPLKLTHIMYKANVNCIILKQLLDSLSQKNLIEEQIFQKRRQQKTVYAITKGGKTVLKHFREITSTLYVNEDVQRPYVFI